MSRKPGRKIAAERNLIRNRSLGVFRRRADQSFVKVSPALANYAVDNSCIEVQDVLIDSSERILCSDHSKAVSRAVGVDNCLLAFRPVDALSMLHAQHALETFCVDMAEYVLVVYLARAGLFPTWVIAYVKSSDVLPGFVDIGKYTDWSTLKPLCGQLRMFSTTSGVIFSSAR